MNRFIIDGFNLAFRSHFAFGELKADNGLYSGCVYGFLVTLRSLKKKYPSFHFTVVWDNEPTRKKAMYVDYKADRPHFDIHDQIRDLKSILKALNVDQAEMLGEEADDVIAAMVEKYLQEEGKIYVYSSDKDLLQLVKNGRVIVIKPKSGGYPEEFFDEEAVKDKFGVYPSEFACFLTFRGDTSDHIPGVPRARSKVLAELASKYKEPRLVYGSLNEEKLTDFHRTKMREFEQQAYTNYSLVKLKDDLDCDVSLGASDEEQVALYLEKYGIKKIPADGLVRVFEEESSFNERQAPAIENISLF